MALLEQKNTPENHRYVAKIMLPDIMQAWMHRNACNARNVSDWLQMVSQ